MHTENISERTSAPLFEDGEPHASQRIGITGVTLFTTIALALHLLGFDDRFAVENGMSILATIVITTWYFPRRRLIIYAFVVQTLWSFADYIHGLTWLICLIGGLTRTAVNTLLIIATRRARKRLALAHGFARSDSLTGLPNRRAIVEALESELCRTVRSGRPFSLALLDCDGFKAINDRQGHLVGDRVLQRIATALEKQTRAYDCIGRLGGDEFVMILSGADNDEVVPIIVRSRKALVQEFHAEFASLSFSIGVVTVRLTKAPLGSPRVTWEECVRQADAAMYTAKRAGRDQNHFLDLEISG